MRKSRLTEKNCKNTCRNKTKVVEMAILEYVDKHTKNTSAKAAE
jgi:hypothetical protein